MVHQSIIIRILNRRVQLNQIHPNETPRSSQHSQDIMTLSIRQPAEACGPGLHHELGIYAVNIKTAVDGVLLSIFCKMLENLFHELADSETRDRIHIVGLYVVLLY